MNEILYLSAKRVFSFKNTYRGHLLLLVCTSTATWFKFQIGHQLFQNVVRGDVLFTKKYLLVNKKGA